MYRGLERSRNKERLEASLAGLCELELLKQRQECLVLSALSLGDGTPGQPGWGDPQPPRSVPPARGQDDLTLRRQLNSLHCHPWTLLAALEQQVGELRVDVEPGATESPGEVEDSQPSSGFYELSEGRSSVGLSDSSVMGEPPPPSCPRIAWPVYPGERPRSVGDAFGAGVPRAMSGPHSSLEGIVEGGAWLWEGEPTAEDYRQAQRVESYILGLIQRRVLPQRPSKPRTSLGPPDSRGVVRQSSLCRKEPPLSPELRDVSPGLEGQAWTRLSLDEQQYGARTTEEPLPILYARPRQAALTGVPRSISVDFAGGPPDLSASESDSPQHFHGYTAPESPTSYDQMVSARYIPAQPCRMPTRGPTHRPLAAPRPCRGGYSPEQPQAQPRPRAAPRKCRINEERPTSRKPGRRASRSQSENSLLGQRGITERKYNTVERDGGRATQAKSKRPQPGNSGYRRWRSTLELSQDEGEHLGDPAPARRPRRARAPGPPYPYSHGSHHHHPEYLEHGLVCRPEEGCGPPALGESESSLSEAESAGSTSLSSDSDESGGLVWPQQLPPQLAPPSPPTLPGVPMQPKAFVKIKASHALKKKILRFRTGSLKVMTTV